MSGAASISASALSTASGGTHLWWTHTRWVLAFFILVAWPLTFLDWDVAIAHRLFFDSNTGEWIAASSPWANAVIHMGGRWVIRAVVVLMFLIWMFGKHSTQLRCWHRQAGYACLAMTLSIALVGALKATTNVDCPWDLETFGGRYPFVPLFADRPDGLPHAHCFPAAHASSGYALVALYFALRERSATLSRWALTVGVVTGLLFGVAQQARGAHFLSHDVVSAFLSWMTCLSVYTFIFDASLARSKDVSSTPMADRLL